MAHAPLVIAIVDDDPSVRRTVDVGACWRRRIERAVALAVTPLPSDPLLRFSVDVLMY